MDRAAAVDRVERLVETVDAELMPVPVREVWVYGDLALGLDPVERLDVYLTKDVLLRDDTATNDDRRRDDTATDDAREETTRENAGAQPPGEAFVESHGIEGVGETVRAAWAQRHPEYLRANENGYAAPERCLAAHLIAEDEPIHLEVCNTGFEDNVTQRLRGALARDAYEEILDPRGVCLWVDGRRSEQAFEKLRDAELPFPKLSEALAMLGVDEETAAEAARAVHDYRAEQEGATVRGDVV